MEGRVSSVVRDLGPADLDIRADLSDRLRPGNPRETHRLEIAATSGPSARGRRTWVARAEGATAGFRKTL